jgi:hypothetical protein
MLVLKGLAKHGVDFLLTPSLFFLLFFTGNVSYVLTKDVTHFVASDASLKSPSYKMKTAQRMKLKIVDGNYIKNFSHSGTLQEIPTVEIQVRM